MAKAEFVRSLHLITVNGHVAESEKMIKRITRCQEGTREHGTDRISNVSMRTLEGPNLMGRLWSRRLDDVSGLRKQVKDFSAATKFSSEVHPNVFGIDRGSGTLGAKSSTVKRVTEMVTMVTKEYVRRFAMQAADATNALAVLGRLLDKVEVDRNTLIALSRPAGRNGKLVDFEKLRLEVDPTGINLGGDK
jgi:GTP1/Obg family GTP-binding protein